MSSPSIGGTSSIVTLATGAATRHAKSDASKSVMVRVPLQPRLTCSQKRSRPTPNGETTPIPVMTTLGSPEWCMTATYTIWSLTRFDRLFVWLGGALFAVSLAVCAYCYLFVWGSTVEGRIDAVATNALLFGIFAAHHS